MSRVVQRMRMTKSLEGLPPPSDRRARVDYIWRRIQNEASAVIAEQETAEDASESSFSSCKSTASRASAAPASTGRRSSIAVARQMNYFFLSCECLLQSVARRICSLICVSASGKSNNNSTNNGDAQQQYIPSMELDHGEMLSYFCYYNRWKMDPAAEAKEEAQIAALHRTRCVANSNNSVNSNGNGASGAAAVAASSAAGPPTEIAPVSEAGSAATSGNAGAQQQQQQQHGGAANPCPCPCCGGDDPLCVQLNLERRSYAAQRARFLASLAMTLEEYVAEDLIAVYDRDPASLKLYEPILYFKGFQALQLHRLAERLWYSGEIDLALMLQSVTSRIFAVDIHPAGRIGAGVMIDHGTGVVIGETAVVGDNASILHNVTLGGTGKELVDRHPKIGSGVLLGAGSCVLGNVTIGDRSRIAAGAVVVKSVPPDSTVIGVAAKPLPPRDPAATARLPEQPLSSAPNTNTPSATPAFPAAQPPRSPQVAPSSPAFLSLVTLPFDGRGSNNGSRAASVSAGGAAVLGPHDIVGSPGLIHSSVAFQNCEQADAAEPPSPTSGAAQRNASEDGGFVFSI